VSVPRDLRELELTRLSELFGRWSEDLYAKARGLSDSVVSNEWEPKSVGEQETFEVNTLDPDFILQRVRALAAEVFTRLQRQCFRACRTATITVRFAHFRTVTRSQTSRDQMLRNRSIRVAGLFAPFLMPEKPARTKSVSSVSGQLVRDAKGKAASDGSAASSRRSCHATSYGD
jgi:nucleotidyltransferase/DNA polymerase involved in DNA repair